MLGSIRVLSWQLYTLTIVSVFSSRKSNRLRARARPQQIISSRIPVESKVSIDATSLVDITNNLREFNGNIFVITAYMPT